MNAAVKNTRSTSMSKKRQAAITIIAIGIGLAASLVICEIALRYWHHRIETSSRIDPGLLVYDAFLGWRLDRNWQGRHRHHDFDVSYSTDRYGFRSGSAASKKDQGKTWAVVGDSFTFCLGVNDDETFVEHLNAAGTGRMHFQNFGVPGYSTDQEYLLIRDQVVHFSPDGILLVVYLGNDLFDNQLAWPLQVEYAKPYFTLGPAGIVLNNSPAPMGKKPDSQVRKDMETIGIGAGSGSGPFFSRQLSRLEMIQLVRANLPSLFPASSLDQASLDVALELFFAILHRIRSLCGDQGAALVLALMPGKSFVEIPGSHSERFQDYFRQKIMERCRREGISTIDLAGELRKIFGEQGQSLFHPNEGHMTPQGQETVAGILKRRL